MSVVTILSWLGAAFIFVWNPLLSVLERSFDWLDDNFCLPLEKATIDRINDAHLLSLYERSRYHWADRRGIPLVEAFNNLMTYLQECGMSKTNRKTWMVADRKFNLWVEQHPDNWQEELKVAQARLEKEAELRKARENEQYILKQEAENKRRARMMAIAEATQKSAPYIFGLMAIGVLWLLSLFTWVLYRLRIFSAVWRFILWTTKGCQELFHQLCYILAFLFSGFRLFSWKEALIVLS